MSIEKINLPAAYKKEQKVNIKSRKKRICKVVEAERERCTPLLWGIYKSTTHRAFSNSTLLS